MIRDILPSDKNIFLSMAKKFYSSNAVTSNVDPRNFENTFNAAIAKSPFLRAFIIEDSESIAGYALLSFTYSNEVGGMVVLVEELFIYEEYRNRGLGKQFFSFINKEFKSAKRFRLEVTESNKNAFALYNRLGYKSLNYIQMVNDI